MSIKKYKITIENIGMVEFKEGQIIAIHNIESKDIVKRLSSSKTIKELLIDNLKLNVDTIIGYAIETDEYNECMFIGHEGSDCGNINSIAQVVFHWEEVV